MKRTPRAAALALGLLLAVPSAARAEWDDGDCKKEVAPEQVGPDPALQGVRLKVQIKVAARQDPLLIALGNEGINFKVADALLRAGALEEEGIKDGVNVCLYGWMSKDGRTFNVMNLHRLEDDLTLARKRIATLEAAGDVAGLKKLAEQVRAMGVAAKKREAYDPIAKDADRAAIALEEKAAKPDDAAAWVALSDDYLRLLGDRQGALDRLVKAIRPGEAPSPEVQKRLEQIDAVVYGGEYVLFEEMKRREGYVDKGGKWVRRERAEFEEAVQGRLQNRANVRKHLPEYYREVAASGSTETGMNKDEVSRAIGFPDEIDRIRIGNDIMDAWSYEGRGWYYFDGGVLYVQPDAPR